MPNPYEHAARIREPEQFDRFRRESAIYRYGDSAAGIDLIIGIQIGAGEDNEDVEQIQSVRAYVDSWPIDAFRAWLESVELEATMVVEAEEKPEPLEFADRTYSILGCELFAVGDYGSKGRYTIEDLQEMIRCHEETGFIAALKPGHVERSVLEDMFKQQMERDPKNDAELDSFESSLPAFGWVENLRIEFDGVPSPTLVADFVSLQEPVYNAIKSRSYDKVSVEILKEDNGVEFCGHTYGAILYAVGLLGHAPPEVAQLKPLHLATFTPPDLSSLGGTWSRPVNFASNLKTGAAVPSKGREDMNLKEQLEAKTKELEAQAKKVEELEAQIAKFSKGHGGDEKLAEMQAAMKSQAEELETLRKKFSDERTERVADRIASKVADIKIPALRKFGSALYGIANRETTKPIVFTKGEGEPADASMEEILDEMFDVINSDAAALFSEASLGSGDSRSEGTEDPRAIVHDKAKKFQSEMAEKGKKVSFSEATRIVLDEDPSLKAAYSGRGNLPAAGGNGAPKKNFKII